MLVLYALLSIYIDLNYRVLISKLGSCNKEEEGEKEEKEEEEDHVEEERKEECGESSAS